MEVYKKSCELKKQNNELKEALRLSRAVKLGVKSVISVIFSQICTHIYLLAAIKTT